MKNILILTPDYLPKVSGVATCVNHFVKSLPAKNTVVLTTKSCWKIWRAIKKFKIDILFVHDAWKFGCRARLMKKLFQKPFLVFSHGADIRTASASKFKLARLWRVARDSEQVIVDSEFLKKHWLHFLPQLENKIRVVYPSTDPDFFQTPVAEEIEKMRHEYALNGKVVILTVSSLTEGKGIPHMLRLMPEILKSVPNLVWVLVGDGPKKQFVIEMIQKNNLQNVVRFLGAKPHDEIKKFYYLADLFVLLTHPDEGKEEGVGMVFLEAAACGLPVVAGKSGGVPEAVHDGETGVLADIYRGDELLIRQITDLLKNPERLKQLGSQAKLRVQYDFSSEIQLAKIKQWL